MKTLLSCILAILSLSSCGYANIDSLKSNANEMWHQQGYQVIAYEGYQWGWWVGGRYGGAHAWYRLRRIPDNGLQYSGYLQNWGDEIHVYGPWPNEKNIVMDLQHK